MRVLSNDGKVVVVEDPSESDLERIARENPGAQIVVVLKESKAPPAKIPRDLHRLEVAAVEASGAEVAAAQLRARRTQFYIETSKAVTRRELLRGEVFVKRPIPQVLPELCTARFGCSECADVCPSGALKIVDREVKIDPSSCSECGLCISACPTGALVAPSADDVEVAAALNTARLHGLSKIAFTCYKSDRVAKDGEYVYKLPCIGALGPEWLLGAISVGGTVEVSCPDPGCPAGGAKPAVELAKRVAEAFGMAAEDVEGGVVVRGQRRMMAFSGARRRDYIEILSKLRDSYTGKRALELKVYRVDVDPNKCSLCGVCFAKCPQRAFDVSRDGDAVKLYLNPLKCVGCGLCEAICPERAIAVSRHEALPGDLEEKAVDYVVRCKSCGRPFDTMRHINAVKQKLGIKGDPEWLYLCPDCRRYYTAKRLLESALKRSQ